MKVSCTVLTGGKHQRITYRNGAEIGVADHVGIVKSCDGSIVYTIEGNANNACKQLSYTVGDRRILGYGMIT